MSYTEYLTTRQRKRVDSLRAEGWKLCVKAYKTGELGKDPREERAGNGNHTKQSMSDRLLTRVAQVSPRQSDKNVKGDKYVRINCG